MKKRFGIISLVTLLVAVALLCILSVFSISEPYNDAVTSDALKAATQTCDYILAQVNDSPSSESSMFSYYEISGDVDFSELFDFDGWSISNSNIVSQDTPTLVLRFAEAWILELYPDGTACAHNGYAQLRTKSDCYYTFSTNALDSIIAYMKEYAIPHTLGDGTVGIGTFHY